MGPRGAQEAPKKLQVEPKRRPRHSKLSQTSLLKAETGKNMKIKLSPARELDFEDPGHPKLDPKSTKINSKSSQDRLRSLLGTVFESFLSNKSAQERPRASQRRPRASQERLRSAQERAKSDPRAVWASLEGCMWLHVVASGGSPAALGGRWRGGGEVNLSVNDHQAVFVQHLAALRRGAGGLYALREARRPSYWPDCMIGWLDG